MRQREIKNVAIKLQFNTTKMTIYIFSIKFFYFDTKFHAYMIRIPFYFFFVTVILL